MSDADAAKLWLQEFQDRIKVTLHARASMSGREGGKEYV